MGIAWRERGADVYDIYGLQIVDGNDEAVCPVSLGLFESDRWSLHYQPGLPDIRLAGHM